MWNGHSIIWIVGTVCDNDLEALHVCEFTQENGHHNSNMNKSIMVSFLQVSIRAVAKDSGPKSANVSLPPLPPLPMLPALRTVNKCALKLQIHAEKDNQVAAATTTTATTTTTTTSPFIDLS